MLKKQYVKSRQVYKVTFELPKTQFPEGLKVQDVALAGSFNEWDPAATPMKRAKGGAYRATIEFEPGQEHQFRYVVNGEHWCNDWNADGYAPNDYGEDNCILAMPALEISD